MKNSKKIVSAVLALLLFGALYTVQAVERFQYIEKTGGKVSYFTWAINGGNPVIVTSEEKERQFRNICRLDGSTLEWNVNGFDDWIRVNREGDTLKFSARIGGETVNKTEDVDGDPWFQALSFSLRQWLQSDKDSIRFWIVRLDNLDIHKMKAVRDGIVMLDMDGKKVKAHQVKVKLAGAFAMFWSVSYWFRVEDYQMVRYEGVHGGPGTPKTIVTLNDA